MSVGHHTSSMRMHLGLDEAEGTHRMCKSQEEWAPRSKDKKNYNEPNEHIHSEITLFASELLEVKLIIQLSCKLQYFYGRKFLPKHISFIHTFQSISFVIGKI